MVLDDQIIRPEAINEMNDDVFPFQNEITKGMRSRMF